MWLSFAIGVVACSLLLYLPGFFLFRAMGFSCIHSVLLAPVGSLSAYCLLGIVFSKLGICSSWLNVALPALSVYLVVFCVRFWHAKKGQTEHSSSGHWVSLALYLCFGIVIGIYVYAVSLGSPEAFLQEYDNAFHLQVVRAFADSGSWSVFDVSKYLTVADASIDPFSSSGFYPALWHVLCVLVLSALGCSVQFSANVVNFTMASVLFPISMMLLLSTIFSDERTVRLGALCTPAFVAFPWMMLYWGPLYANVLALCLTPLAASLFVRGVNGLISRSLKLRVLLAFFLSLFLLVVSQTSAVFFCVIFLAPYCVYRLWTLGRKVALGSHPISCKTLAIVFVVFTVSVWSVLVFAPFMRNVVFGFNWPATLSPIEAFLEVLKLEVGWVPSQGALAIAVLVGIGSTLRQRQYLWLSVSYALFAITFILCASTEGFAKHFLGGFWYTDSFRILACLALAGIPLSVQGLTAIARFLHGRIGKRHGVSMAAAGVLLVLFCILVYRPGIWINGSYLDSAFGKMRWEFKQGNDADRPILFDTEEQRFVEKVIELIPEGSVVLNMPDDGSAYAYATKGLRTFYRDYRDYEGSKHIESQSSHESEESQILRKGADRISIDQEVQAAFQKLGIQYVLVLDYGDSLAQQPKVSTYEEELWTGISSIADDNPGFSLLLSEGDMRLYKVEM